MITLTVLAVLFLTLGLGGNAARADGGCQRGKWAPAVTYYAPYPIWWPQYFGPPYSDYQVVQYVMPPAQTAAMVKAHIRIINAANPALLPPPSEPLAPPKRETLPLPK